AWPRVKCRIAFPRHQPPTQDRPRHPAGQIAVTFLAAKDRFRTQFTYGVYARIRRGTGWQPRVRRHRMWRGEPASRKHRREPLRFARTLTPIAHTPFDSKTSMGYAHRATCGGGVPGVAT